MTDYLILNANSDAALHIIHHPAAKTLAESRGFTPKDTELCFSFINDEGERVLSLVCPNKNR